MVFVEGVCVEFIESVVPWKVVNCYRNWSIAHSGNHTYGVRSSVSLVEYMTYKANFGRETIRRCQYVNNVRQYNNCDA